MKITSKIVTHSIRESSRDELITFQVVFPRIILPEVLTHRAFSRNTSSHRAVPFNKVLEIVKDNPFIPIAFQKNHKGMQGFEYFTNEEDIEKCKLGWLQARNKAVETSKTLYDGEVTKQLCNRLLEPYMWCTMLITTSKEGLDNFFKLRCPNYNGCKSWKELCDLDSNYNMETPILERLKLSKSTAEIHIQTLAEVMYDGYNESKPKVLKGNDWHIPFESQIEKDYPGIDLFDKIKVATSLTARVSYTVIPGTKELSIDKHKELYQLLIDESHQSPQEHCAVCMDKQEYNCFIKGMRKPIRETINSTNTEYVYNINTFGYCNNFRGFIPLRYIIDNNKNLL